MIVLSVLLLKSETYCIENVQINARKIAHFICQIKIMVIDERALEFKAMLRRL